MVTVWSALTFRLKALLRSGGASFYDPQGYFVKTPMVSLVAIGQGFGESDQAGDRRTSTLHRGINAALALGGFDSQSATGERSTLG